jgi:hypothetical protein
MQLEAAGFLSLEKKKFSIWSWVPVAHVCNPSYSGGTDQKDHEILSRKTLHEKGLVEWLKM